MPTPEDQSNLQAALDRLREGRLVAFPTETVYGLAADARNPDAVQRVFDRKGRPARNPLIVHVADAAMAKPLVSAWPREAQRLADRFWPGPLTIVLPRSSLIPDVVTAGGTTVALRCPDHPLALALLRAFNGPLVGPSANPSGTVSPTRAEHVAAAFNSSDVLVLDGGPCRVGIESTVLSLAHHPPRLLRLGAISADDIEAALQQPIDRAIPTPAHTDTPLASPGLLERHYAPRAPVVLYTHDAIPEMPGHSVQLAIRARALPRTQRHVVQMPTDAEQYAARLYEALRAADERRPDVILVEWPDAPGSLWDAIRDRLRRASA